MLELLGDLSPASACHIPKKHAGIIGVPVPAPVCPLREMKHALCEPKAERKLHGMSRVLRLCLL